MTFPIAFAPSHPLLCRGLTHGPQPGFLAAACLGVARDMATYTLLESAGDTQLQGTTRPPRLWQVPTFVVGLLALAAVAYARPGRQAYDPGRQLQRDLTTLRRALQQPSAPDEKVLAHAEGLLSRVEELPQGAGEVHLLLGSVELRLAERSPAARATELRRRALGHLQQAEAHGVPEADQPRLHYRLGQAYFHSGDLAR